MSKLQARVRMKRLLLLRRVAEVELSRSQVEAKYPGPLVGAMSYALTQAGRAQIHMVAQTPARLFRHDKPEIDKRRWAKHQAKQRAKLDGTEYIVKINQGGQHE